MKDCWFPSPLFVCFGKKERTKNSMFFPKPGTNSHAHNASISQRRYCQLIDINSQLSHCPLFLAFSTTYVLWAAFLPVLVPTTTPPQQPTPTGPVKDPSTTLPNIPRYLQASSPTTAPPARARTGGSSRGAVTRARRRGGARCGVSGIWARMRGGIRGRCMRRRRCGDGWYGLARERWWGWTSAICLGCTVPPAMPCGQKRNCVFAPAARLFFRRLS